MDRFLPRFSAFLLVLALAACGTIPVPGVRTAQFGVAQTLAVHDSITFNDALVLTLDRIDDSRCKANVQCVWEGELAPAFTLRGGELGSNARTVQMGTSRGKTAQVGAYTLTLGTVTVGTGTPDTATVTVTRGGTVPGDSLRVDTPQAGQTVSSPLTVRGSARGPWYFEATFPVTLLDGHGQRLAQTHATAQGEWMTTDWVPFSASLTFAQPTTATGTLLIENANPSGLPGNAQSRRIEVQFANAGGAGTGVRGTAHAGPTCPVERTPPDPNCADRPYVGVFAIHSVGGAHVADVTTGADGRFSLALPPGSYQLRLRDANRMPSMAPQAFTVRSDGWTTLDVSLDSGIR